MEADMKGICEGAKTKQDVIMRSLELYRNVFVVAMNNTSMLNQVSHLIKVRS